MPRAILALLALLLGAAGCSLTTQPASDDIQLRLESTLFAAGDTVRADLINHTGDDLGYGFCSLSLERETPEGWIQVSPTPEVCPGVLIVLTPGTRAARRQAIDPTLPPGSYRLRQQVMPGAKLPEISVVSAAFALRAPD